MRCGMYSCTLRRLSVLVHVGHIAVGLAVAQCRIVAQGAVGCLLFVAGIVVALVV